MKGLVIGIVLILAGLCNSVWASDNDQYDSPEIQNPIFWRPPKLPTSIVIVPTLPEQPTSHDNTKKERIAPKTSETPEPPAAASRPPRPERQDVSFSVAACQGEACQGSGNTNPELLGELEALGFPTPGNSMQFAFPDGTKACAVFTNGEAGSEQLGSGDLLVDNAENWIVLQHSSTASGMGNCDPSKTFCVYAPDCESKLGHVTIQQATTKDGSVVNYTGNYYLNDGICGVDGVCGSSGGIGGCYPSTSGSPNYVCSSVIEDGGDTVSDTGWEDTLGSSTINPYAAGIGEFNNASRGVPNLPLGTAN